MRTCLYISKYMYSLILLGLSIYITGEPMYLFYGILELSCIFFVSNLISSKSVLAAHLFNDIVLFLFNLETLILLFSGTYLKMIMIGNINSFESLSGQFSNYLIGIVTLIIFTFLPFKRMKISFINQYRCISVALLAIVILVMENGASYSPFYSLKALYDEKKDIDSLVSDLDNKPDKTLQFYNKEIESYYDGAPFGDSSPNIVLIFVEGLSQNIVEDERNIMPNLKLFEEESINFINYFNHTAATYRGIISQLYSGYQAEDTGGSNTLVSLQSILADKGYNTIFINAEPKNATYSRYLKGLGFENVTTSQKTAGQNKSLSDKQTFKLLMSTMKKEVSNTTPFFIAMYTFGTHNTFDSPDETFENGDNALLNKFYNLDYQFGLFFEEFKSSPFYDNTLLVFTSDHCTYYSEDFRRTFPECERVGTFLDRIPFAIFHKGVLAHDRDVLGRNSLDLAPTLLDYIGITAPHYFLGSSLFNPKVYSDSIETVFYSGDFMTSRGGSAAILEAQRETTARRILSDYFIANRQEPKVPD